jgi:intracellular multiplication protein IcmW
MSDLTIKGVHHFWNQFDDPMIYRVVSFMDSVEKWTHDENPEFEEAIAALSLEFEDFSKVDMTKLGQQNYFIRIANHLHFSRALRFLHIIDGLHPGSASRLLAHGEETTESPTDEAGLFLRRNIVFERLRLLGRVFSQERLELVSKALEGEDQG